MGDFLYTDRQLNVLNQGKNVYSVNPEFAKREGYPVIMDTISESPSLNEMKIKNVITVDNQDFQVIKTYSDPKTGFDGMAVAPIIDDKIDLKHVAVVAAGTDPNAKDLKLRIATVSPVGMEPMAATVTIS